MLSSILARSHLLSLLGVIALMHLLGASVAVACSGGGEGSASMTVSPKPSVKFTKVNETHIVTTKNTGFVTFNTLEVFVNSGFKLINGKPDTCTGKVLAPGESCLQMVECVTAGKTGTFLAVTTNTLATDSTKLEC